MKGRARTSDARLASLIAALRELASQPMSLPGTPNAARLEGAHRDAARDLAARLHELLTRLPSSGG